MIQPLPRELTLRDQCLRTLLSLGHQPFLRVYDNAAMPERVESWLPPAGAGGHVIVTSTWDRWDLRRQRVQVPPMHAREAARLVAAIVGIDEAGRDAQHIVDVANGLPVQLVPRSGAAPGDGTTAEARNRTDLTDEARASFDMPWHHLPAEGRLVLMAATCFHPDRVRTCPSWRPRSVRAAPPNRRLTPRWTAASISLLTGETPWRLHALLARYVREHATDIDADQWRRIHKALGVRFMEAALAVLNNPGDAIEVKALTAFWPDPARWQQNPSVVAPGPITAAAVALALCKIGHFVAALPWCKHALAEAERGDVHGRVDHERLSGHLHLIGLCLSEQGQFAAAQPWYERAVAEAEGRRARPRRPREPRAAASTTWAPAFVGRGSSPRRSRGMSARSRRRNRATCMAASTTRAWAAASTSWARAFRRGAVRGGAAVV